MTAAFDPLNPRKEKKLKMPNYYDVEIKDVSATTTGADTGKQLVTLIFQIDNTHDIDDELQKGDVTGIELPSRRPPA